MNERFPKEYMSENAAVRDYFETLPTSLKEIIMQDNSRFESVEEIKAFAENFISDGRG